MATSKSDVKESSGSSSSRLFKTFDIALRKSERHLLLSTTYGLNSSWSKKITVGLALRFDGTFLPVVRLINNYSTGVVLNVHGWELLGQRFDQIDAYFGGESSNGGSMVSELLADTVYLDGCSLRFTKAHKSRSIAFYETPRDPFMHDAQPIEAFFDNEDEDDDNEGPAKKKQKTWTPLIVMQKTTFEGLKHMTCCIDEHIAKLTVLAEEINRYKEGLVTFFSSVIKARKMSSPTLQQIGVVVCEEAENAKDVVAVQCSESFRDNHSNIVFCELSRLFLAYIIADIRQRVLTGSASAV